MRQTRTIQHDESHTDTEELFGDVWAVTQCNCTLVTQEITMSTQTMTPLEYAKSYAAASRIPESVLTMGGLVALYERIATLEAEIKNLDEGARLLHSLATGGESKLLADWQDTPEIKEANQASDKFNYDAVKETEF
jgi:hypothetical protein